MTKITSAEVDRIRRRRSRRCWPFAAPASAADIGACLITKTDTNPFFVKMKEGARPRPRNSASTLKSYAGKIDGDNESQVAAIET